MAGTLASFLVSSEDLEEEMSAEKEPIPNPPF